MSGLRADVSTEAFREDTAAAWSVATRWTVGALAMTTCGWRGLAGYIALFLLIRLILLWARTPSGTPRGVEP